MKNKKISIFEELKNAVSKLPDWVSSHVPVVHKKKPESPFTPTVLAHSSESFVEMDLNEFEKLVHTIFKQRGYSISEAESESEYEIDLVLKTDTETAFVQFKKWKETEIDVTKIIKVYTAMKERNARHGIVITAGEFTSEALDFALGKALLLINGTDLSQMVETLNEPGYSSDTEQSDNDESHEEDIHEPEPVCPICSEKMIKRRAKKGKNAGNTFWGCSKFPSCRGVLQNNKTS